MKKLITHLSALALLISLLTGCFALRKSKKSETVETKKSEPTTITDSLEAKAADSAFQMTPDTLVAEVDTALQSPDTIPTVKIPDTITVVMVGDVMLGTNYPNAGYLPPNNNCWPLLSPVAEYLSDADISFCNMEGVLAGSRGTPKYCRNPKTCYVFRMPEEYSTCFTQAGFDVVSVANNHVNDFGAGGRANAVEVLNASGLHFAGFSDHPYTIFESNGLIIGFCAFAPNQGVQDLRNISAAKQLVSMLADTCDLVLVSMHGGAEGSKYQHVTRQREIFLGADRGNVYQFAHAVIDAGADVVIGHGPHVTRAIEMYNDRFIAYSLGNFSTYGRFNLSGPNGMAPIIKIWITKEGDFIKGTIIPIRQLGQGGAVPDPEKRVIYKIQDLTKMDFPDGKLNIDNNGEISKK